MKVVAILGGADAAVIHIALQLGEVIAVGINRDDATMQRAARAGARRLVSLWDDALAAADDMALVPVIAAVARRLEAQLFVIGESMQGYLGPALADQFNLPHVSGVLRAERIKDRDRDKDPAQKDQDPEGGKGEEEIPFENTAAVRVWRRALAGVQRLHGPAAGVLCVLPETTLLLPAASASEAAQTAAAPKTEAPVEPETSASALEQAEVKPPESEAASDDAPPAAAPDDLDLDMDLGDPTEVNAFIVEHWDLGLLGINPADLPRPLLRPVTPEQREKFVARAFDSLTSLALRLRQDGLR